MSYSKWCVLGAGWQTILEAFHIAPCTVTECVRTVRSGHLLAISPGGVREAQFSDHSYALLWGSRTGFAKVALQADCVSNAGLLC